MKKNICLLVVLSVLATSVNAQDEGDITKRDRIALDKGIFLGLGPSFTFGKNIGDYSTGLNFEVGYTSRLNRVVSVGASLSYMSFKYDPEKTGVNNAFILDEMYPDPEYYYYYYWPAMVVDFKGGDMNLISLAANIKVNLVPVMDNSTISVYVFAKPFITMANRTKVSGTAYVYRIIDYYDDGIMSEDEIYDAVLDDVVPWEAGDPRWQEFGLNISDKLNKDSRVTGGVFVGPGIEFFPAKKVSFYAQAAFGYTLPVSFVSTKKYEGNSIESLDEEFPIIEQGFPSINLQFGISLNF